MKLSEQKPTKEFPNRKEPTDLSSQAKTALSYMQKQVKKHKQNYDRILARTGTTQAELNNMREKIDFYEAAVIALIHYESRPQT